MNSAIGNNNGDGTTSQEVLAKISRLGSPAQKGTNPAASDIFWIDSASREHSFLNEARGKVALLCIGGLWSIYSNPMFNTVDSLLNFYGRDSLYALRVFTYGTSRSGLADSIAFHRWHGRFVYDSTTRSLDNYQQVGAAGVPYTAIIDRNGHIATWRIGGYPVDTAARMFERLIDSVKNS